MSEYPRPRMCPEPRCRPLMQIPAPTFLVESHEDPRRRDEPPGESWACWGCMAEPIRFIYDGVEHPNDLRFCFYTPLKGLVAMQENESDWLELERGYRKAHMRLLRARGVPEESIADATPAALGAERRLDRVIGEARDAVRTVVEAELEGEKIGQGVMEMRLDAEQRCADNDDRRQAP